MEGFDTTTADPREWLNAKVDEGSLSEKDKKKLQDELKYQEARKFSRLPIPEDFAVIDPETGKQRFVRQQLSF